MSRGITAAVLWLALLSASSGALAEDPTYVPSKGTGWEDRIGARLALGEGGRVDVPLEFVYFGQPFYRARIADDGFVQFLRPGEAPDDAPLDDPVNGPWVGFVIAPFWSYLDASRGGTISFNTLGDAPNRVYLVTWLDVAYSDPLAADPSSFQLRLEEATGRIQFTYRSVDTDRASWATALFAASDDSQMDEYVGLPYDVFDPDTTPYKVSETSADVSVAFLPTGVILAEAARQAREGQRLLLDGSRSHLASPPPDWSSTQWQDDPIVSWQWDLGDGRRASGPTVTASYRVEGTYTVALTVTGQSGATLSDDTRITVFGDPPQARAHVLNTGVQYGRPALFTAAGSADDRGIETYLWDFGDGSAGQGELVVHRYQSAGTFAVKLTVRDAAGQTSTTTVSAKVTAGGPPEAGEPPGAGAPAHLYAGGFRPGRVYEHLGSGNWETISPVLGEAIVGLAEFDGELYAAVEEASEESGSDWWEPSAVYRRSHFAGGGSWERVGQVLNSRVTSLASYRGRLYVGTSDVANAVMVLDPATGTWVPLFQTSSGTYSMKVIDDALYVGNYNSDYIHRFDGQTSTPVMQFGGSCIWDLAKWNDTYFASAFSGLYYASEGADDQWARLGAESASHQNMWALETYQGRLYGGVDRGDAPRAGLMVFDPGSESFVPATAGPDQLPLEFEAASDHEGVISLATDDRCLYLGLGGEPIYTGTGGGTGKVWGYCDGTATDLTPTGEKSMGEGVPTLLTTWVEARGPEVEEFRVTPANLWPPDHGMVELKPTFTAADAAGGALRFQPISVKVTEWGLEETCFASPDGYDAGGDVRIDADGRIWVRADRPPGEWTRRYTVTGVLVNAEGDASTPVSAVADVSAPLTGTPAADGGGGGGGGCFISEACTGRPCAGLGLAFLTAAVLARGRGRRRVGRV